MTERVKKLEEELQRIADVVEAPPEVDKILEKVKLYKKEYVTQTSVRKIAQALLAQGYLRLVDELKPYKP